MIYSCRQFYSSKETKDVAILTLTLLRIQHIQTYWTRYAPYNKVPRRRGSREKTLLRVLRLWSTIHIHEIFPNHFSLHWPPSPQPLHNLRPHHTPHHFNSYYLVGCTFFLCQLGEQKPSLLLLPIQSTCQSCISYKSDGILRRGEGPWNKAEIYWSSCA